MATYFLDTSAIVKRYILAEQGHTWTVNLCDPAQGHKLYIAQVALVEVVAAMCRKTRAQRASATDRDQLIAKFRRDVQNDFDIWRVTNAVYTRGGDLCRLHVLRAYDAVQLACALGLRDKALADHAPAPTFVCADNNLLSIAMAEGLSIENPNNYPAKELDDHPEG